MSKDNCKVCGFQLDFLPWGEDGNSPTYEICSCCGVEFGYEDYTIESAKRYREEWISNEAIWFKTKEKPKDWDLIKQLKNVPKEYY